MGSPEAGKAYLEYWISQADPDFSTDTTFNFDTTVCASYLTDIKAEPDRLTASMKVTQRIANEYGTAHGGSLAAIVDTITVGAIASVSPKFGLSLALSCDYFSPMPVGEVMDIEARVVKLGARVSHLECDFRRRKTGALIAKGRHVVMMPKEKRPQSKL